MYQPLWDGTSFDFDASIFPLQLLEPIKRQIPAQFPEPNAPGPTSAATVVNHQQQQQHLQEGMGFPPIANFGMTVQPPHQRRPTQQQIGSTTPKRQTDVASQSSPVGEDLVRGDTPEGETREEKAVRYRDQLKSAAARKMADSMSKQGYDVQKYGVSPALKVGGLLYSVTFSRCNRTNHRSAKRPPRPKPTPPETDGSPMAAPKNVIVSPTPARVRRSARTRNTKPKYTDSPGDLDLDLSPKDKSDPAWNASADKSDDSWSPEMQTKGGRGQNRRATLDSTSSASSPVRGKSSLSNTILDYQRSTGNLGIPKMTAATSSLNDPFQTGTQSALDYTLQVDSPQLPHTIAGLPYPNQQSFTSNASSTYGQLGQTTSTGGPTRGQLPTMSQDAYQRATPTQRSTYLAQQLGRSLYQQQLASGIVGASTARVSTSPQSPQEATSSGLPYPSHFAHTQAPSGSPLQSAPDHFGGMSYGGLPMAPANIFQQNYQNSMGQVPIGRSFSTGSASAAGAYSPAVRNSPMPTLNSNFQPNSPAQHNYESMRRSFSSTANLAPHGTVAGDHAVPVSSPSKRSVPPSGLTAARKRVRLSLPGQSLPGEDEAPVLRPSASSFQLHAPAGLPADENIDFAASIKAIEDFERGHAAVLSTTLATSDPQHPGVHDDSTQAPMNTRESTKETADSNPQLPASQYSTQSYETAQTLGDAILVPADTFGQSSQPSQQSDFNEQSQTNDANHHPADDDVKDAVSEPDWSLIADDVFQMP